MGHDSNSNSSNSNGSPRSHATAWTIVALILLPVLYFLSVPPAVIFTMKPRGSLPLPRILELYIAPSYWLHDHTPLEEPLDQYFGWWRGKTHFYIDYRRR